MLVEKKMQTQLEPIPDFTHLTCTNLFIKVKIRAKHLESGDKFSFIMNPTGQKTIGKYFSQDPYSFTFIPLKNGRFKGIIHKI